MDLDTEVGTYVQTVKILALKGLRILELILETNSISVRQHENMSWFLQKEN